MLSEVYGEIHALMEHIYKSKHEAGDQLNAFHGPISSTPPLCCRLSLHLHGSKDDVEVDGKRPNASTTKCECECDTRIGTTVLADHHDWSAARQSAGPPVNLPAATAAGTNMSLRPG